MHIPPGDGPIDVATGLHVMESKHNLYGLRQSPRNWFNTINNSLKDIEFTNSK